MVNPQDLLAFARRAYEQHSQPLKERASILPLGQYEDGSVGMAWPGLLAGPAEAWKRMYDTAASSPVMDDDTIGQMSRDSFDAAGLAMTGGLGAGLAGGLADDALKATVDLPASAAFKFGDEIFDAGQGRYHANAIRDAVAAKGKDAINATWDQNSGFGDMEGFVSLGGNFQTRKQAADAIRSSGKAGDEFIGDELHASTLNDFRSRGLWANAPTGSSVPLAVNALERQPYIVKNKDGTYYIHRSPKGRPIGQATVTMDDTFRPTDAEPGAAFVDLVEVSPRHRGKGVASYLYDEIEKDLGMKLRPSGSLTEDGYAFWSKRDPNAIADYEQSTVSGAYMPRADFKADIPRLEARVAELEASSPNSEALRVARLLLDDRNRFAANAKTGAAVPLAMNALERAGAELPMDLASRMARAKEMGFDTDNVWYHGTDKPGFTEFANDAVGSRYGQDGAGHFFMGSPKRAEQYTWSREGAGETVGAIYPTHIRGGQFLLDENAARSIDPAMLDDMQNGSIGVWDNWKDQIRSAAGDAENIVIDANGERMMVAMDPRNIRSVNAAFDPAMSDSANLLAANAKTGAAVPLATNALERQPQGIRAYHGSPHDFDRFSLDNIGTGEGAQAYGHGLYFADSEDVARSYRDALAKPGSYGNTPPADVPIVVNGQVADGPAREALSVKDVDFATAGEAKRFWEQQLKETDYEPFRDLIKALEPFPDDAPVNKGRMYEVNIKANPEDFLDWDKPLAEQTSVLEKLKPYYDSIGGADRWLETILAGNPTGSRIASSLSGSGADSAAAQAYAAETMKQYGIPGIRYADAYSRPDGSGPPGNTSNYVVFDDQLIDILRKYANPPTGAIVPAGMEASQDQDTDPALIEFLRSMGLI